MKIKLKSIMSVLLAALLLMSSCTPSDPSGDDTDTTVTDSETTPESESDTTPESESAEETEPQQPAEPEPRVTLVANTLTTDTDKVLLNLSCGISDAQYQGELICKLSDNNGVLSEEKLTAVNGESEIVLSCPSNRIAGVLTLTVEAVDADGKVEDSLTLKMKQKLPQLSADSINCVVAAMTLEEKARLTSGGPLGLRGVVGTTIELRNYGIPSIGFSDGPAGVRSDLETKSVWYPSITNISSSWDKELIYRVGEAIGLDGRAFNTDILLAPGMNIQKNIFGGRNFEYSSEDPILTGYLMSAYVNGVQSTGIGAEIKHFAVNNQETARVIYSANVRERALREIYLKGFGIAIRDSAPWAVMSSYNRINRNHNATERELLVDILRDEFGFGGMVTSDWGGVTGSIDNKINAMNDINMPGDSNDPGILAAAVTNGTVSMEALDTCCRNILGVVVKTRTFNREKKDRVDYKAHAEVAREAAENSFVLLQNKDALPLKEGSSVALFGNGAVQTVFGGGGSGVVHSKVNVSIFDGLKQSEFLKLYDEKGNPFIGCKPHDVSNPSNNVAVTEAYAKQCAESAEAAVIVLSREAIEGVDSTNRPGDYLLNQTERDMIERVSAAFHAKGKKVTVLINTGNPIETVSWSQLVDAVVYIGYPGEQAGNAVVNMLVGKSNPSGKLTSTWPVSYKTTPAYDYSPGTVHDVTYYEDIYVGYRYYETFGVDVAYPFGYGLSYTEFTYSDMTVKQNKDGSVTVQITVTNTGDAAGREIVQCYISKPETLMEQAKLELAGFAKTKLLAPGESETVKITVTEDALKSYDEADSAWVLSDGTYTISVGASVQDIRHTATFTVAEKQVILDVENCCVPEVDFEYISKKTYTVPDGDGPENLALGGTVTASRGTAADAVDGDLFTLWNPGYNTAHITLDLGEKLKIGKMAINWNDVSTVFLVQLSDDGKTFTDYRYLADKGSGLSVVNLYGAETRYIRIKIINAINQGIYEWRVYAATEEDKKPQGGLIGENVALKKPVTATSVQGNLSASNAVDGNYNTRWGAQERGEGALVLDLEEIKHIHAIEMLLESAHAPYCIEYSTDGENYTLLHHARANQLMVELTDLDVEARYIRIRRDGDGWFSIFELKVYG